MKRHHRTGKRVKLKKVEMRISTSMYLKDVGFSTENEGNVELKGGKYYLILQAKAQKMQLSFVNS